MAAYVRKEEGRFGGTMTGVAGVNSVEIFHFPNHKKVALNRRPCMACIAIYRPDLYCEYMT